jgi:vitamin B12 transporter
MLLKTTPLLGAGLLLVTPSAFADTLPVFYGDEIVVTPTRTAQRLDKSLAAVTVLTRADIEAAGAPDLPALLAGQAGVEIAQTGTLGAQSAIRIRGSESDQVLILVDGVRIASATAGASALEHILLTDVERVEIVRGNVSSVYGSDAIGGVVQVFTRKGRGKPAATVDVTLGSDAYQRLHAGYGGEVAPGVRIQFGVARTLDGGQSAGDPARMPAPFVFTAQDVDDDDTRNTSFNARLDHQLSDRLSWGLTAWRSASNVDFDGAFQNHLVQTVSAYRIHVSGQPHTGWTSQLSLGRGEDDLHSDLNGTPTGVFRTVNWQGTWENSLDLGPGALRLGLESLHQMLDSDGGYTADSRRVASVFAAYGGSLDAHDWDLSLRRDDYSDVGAATTGRVAYGYALNPAWRVAAALATAFKAPTFNELYSPFGGNPDLDPERQKSAEISVSYSRAGQRIALTAFETRTEDLINFLPPSFTAVNVDEARNRGAELTWNGRLMGLSARATFTVQNPEDASTGLGLLRRADQFGSLALSDRRGIWGWQAELVASGPRPDIDATTFARTTVPGYAVLNLGVDMRPAPDWRLAARLLNAFDKDYALVDGYLPQERAVRLELAWTPR